MFAGFVIQVKLSFAYMQHESTCQVPFSYRPVRYPFSPTLPTSAQFHWQVGGIFHQAIAAAKRCRLRALAPPLPLGNFAGSYFAFCVSTLQKLHLLLSFVILIYNISNDLSFSSLPCIPEIPRGPQPTLAGAVSQRICSDHRGC